MGIKTASFMGKNLDAPGPGMYETDVIPIHHSNFSYFIGTSVRSDLGIGKAYMGGGGGRGGVMKIMKCNNRAGRDNNHLIGRFRQTLGGWGIINN